ncbi:MAG TPA: lysozyme inhibitor LprI family protein [Gaiellaceae bacterium]|jgi:uncharacterized protein YecT (DUF1311 family)
MIRRVPCLLLATFVSVAMSAAAGAVAPLRPPVIRELFTLLPCPTSPSRRDSTIGMEGCQEHMIVASDARIDALAKQIFGQLADDPARRRFVAGEKAWLAYRSAFCNSQSDIFEGGTGAPVEFAGCVVHVNAQHVKDLTEFHGDLGPH